MDKPGRPRDSSDKGEDLVDKLRNAEAELVTKVENDLVAEYALKQAVGDHEREFALLKASLDEIQARLETVRNLHVIVSEMDKLARAAKTERLEAEQHVEELRVATLRNAVDELNPSLLTTSSKQKSKAIPTAKRSKTVSNGEED